MSRLLTRAIRLVKFGAVAGAAVGVGRMILRRRRMAEAGESSWPTIAETAAENGQPVYDAADDGEASPLDADADSEPEESDGTDGEAGERA